MDLEGSGLEMLPSGYDVYMTMENHVFFMGKLTNSEITWFSHESIYGDFPMSYANVYQIIYDNYTPAWPKTYHHCRRLVTERIDETDSSNFRNRRNIVAAVKCHAPWCVITDLALLFFFLSQLAADCPLAVRNQSETTRRTFEE